MLALTVVGSVVLVQFDWFGDAASEEAPPIDTLFDVMVVLSTFVFSIVMVMFGYAIWKFRAKPGDESDGAPIHGNTKLEIAWTVIPTIIVLFGAGYSWIVLDDIEARADDAMPLKVTAQQFKWTFEYPEADGLRSDELHVPVDRQLDVQLEALDVAALILGAGVADQARPGAVRRGRRRDRRRVRGHAERGGHLQPRLHRALRPRAHDDAGDGGGRVAGGLRPVARRPGDRPRRGAGGGILGGRRDLGFGRKDERGSGNQATRPGARGARVHSRLGVRVRARRRPARDLRARDLPDRADRLPAPDRPRDHRPARLPGRARRVRLLVPLGSGQADDPRGPLPARRPSPGATTSSSTPITR